MGATAGPSSYSAEYSGENCLVKPVLMDEFGQQSKLDPTAKDAEKEKEKEPASNEGNEENPREFFSQVWTAAMYQQVSRLHQLNVSGMCIEIQQSRCLTFCQWCLIVQIQERIDSFYQKLENDLQVLQEAAPFFRQHDLIVLNQQVPKLPNNP
jgi:hypothetical protein